MKGLFVSIIFPKEHYLEGKYRKGMFIDHLASKYNSTGSIVFCKGEDPRLWCHTPLDMIEELISECLERDDEIEVHIRKI